MGSHQLRYAEPQFEVQASQVLELVCVRQVLAIPSEQKINTVKRCQSKMERIAQRNPWHQFARLVKGRDIRDLFNEIKQRNSLHEVKALVLIGIIAFVELVKNDRGQKALIITTFSIPPISSPRDVGDQFSAIIAVIRGYGGFDVNGWLHK